MRRRIQHLILLITAPGHVAAQDVAGHWNGSLSRSGQAWRVEVDIGSGASGHWAIVDLPDYGLFHRSAARRGVASLIYDKRGVGRSTGVALALPETYAADAGRRARRRGPVARHPGGVRRRGRHEPGWRHRRARGGTVATCALRRRGFRFRHHDGGAERQRRPQLSPGSWRLACPARLRHGAATARGCLPSNAARTRGAGGRSGRLPAS